MMLQKIPNRDTMLYKHYTYTSSIYLSIVIYLSSMYHHLSIPNQNKSAFVDA